LWNLHPESYTKRARIVNSAVAYPGQKISSHSRKSQSIVLCL
jgi:hypothetical protein